MSWFKRNKEGITTSTSDKMEVPEGLWVRCSNCKTLYTSEDLQRNNYVCDRCSHHERIGAAEYFELIFDDETIVLKAGDTTTVPPHVWHEAKCEKGGKMLTIFKNGQFDLYLEELSKMSDDDFADKELIDFALTKSNATPMFKLKYFVGGAQLTPYAMLKQWLMELRARQEAIDSIKIKSRKCG